MQKVNAAIKGYCKRLADLIQHNPRVLFTVIVVTVITVIQWLELDLSPGTSITKLMTRNVIYQIVDLALVFLVDLLFLLLTRRISLACALGSVFFCIWSLVNYYVRLYANDVVTVMLLRSTNTALNVLGGYSLHISWEVVLILLATAVNLGLSVALKNGGLPPVPWKKLWTVALSMVMVLSVSCATLNVMEHIHKVNDWQPTLDLNKFGYPIYFTRQVFKTLDPIECPEGYDEAIVAQMAERVAEDEPDMVRWYDQDGDAALLTYHEPTGDGSTTGQTLPDIVLILDESYYFLEEYTDLVTSVPYHENYSNLQNAVKGHAVVPWIGSSTNRTEFELLTSDSTYLANCQAPFSTLNMSGANSIVQYLNEFGYTTVAMHDADGSNYSRQRVYPMLGFDEIHFTDDFTPAAYGQRRATDASNFQDMFRWYEQAGDAPRFMYLLTYQNHGGWKQNDESLFTVTSDTDYGKREHDMDEYLTSLKMTDDALQMLIDYFSSVDRPVLLCVLGDHSPNIILDVPAKEGLEGNEEQLVMHSTPLLIWANDAYGPLKARDDALITVPDLAPTLLEMAGLPLSAYYQTMRELTERVPIRLSNGIYRTASGEYGEFSRDDANYGLLAPYYFMEYNNLQRPSERYQVLFDPPRKTGS